MTISERNSSSRTFYERRERRSSLLCHPVGLDMIKEYKKSRSGQSVTVLEKHLCAALASALKRVVHRRETDISSAIRDVINMNWHQSNPENSSVFGEHDEKVEGEIDNSETSGYPDGVVRLRSLEENKSNKIAQLILEVSVDKNGGEKKIGQAFDYDCLMKDIGETVLLFTFHIDRPKSKDGSNDPMKITQEAFIYLRKKKEGETEDGGKMGFLWREIYEQKKEESTLNFLKRSSAGIVRALACAVAHRDSQYLNSSPEWQVVSDNVAIDNKEKKVYKIFDNRFFPTFRRPDQWLRDKGDKVNFPWTEKLGVDSEFQFRESDDVDALGRPSFKKRKHSSYPQPSPTRYPKGSILIIRYNYIDGTHFASRASHFLDIANLIAKMHKDGIVHGDVRGFNMIHPHPKDAEVEKGIEQSLLIDFDLSGKPGEDIYPPGYKKLLLDLSGKKSGTANNKLEKSHDWKDLAAVMALYRPTKINEELLHQWEDIVEKFDSMGEAGIASLEEFIGRSDNDEIRIGKHKRKELEKIQCKGTGSPFKSMQEPRGSVSTVDTT